MDKSIRIFVLTAAMFFAQTIFAQDKRTYRDIAYDYIMQMINYDGQSSWKIVSDKYDKMPNGGYLCTLIISRTTKYYEKELVNNQVQAYGATFNVGVREALVAKEDTQNRRYIVFVDKYGTAHNLVLSRIAPVFHYVNGNVWITNKGRFDDINMDFDCNFACYSYNGDLLWEKSDIAVFSWKHTENNIYFAGNYINNKCSFVGTVNTKTFEYKERLGDNNKIPFSLEFVDDGVKIKQKDDNSNAVSSYTIPYAANDRQYQIDQVLKQYNLTKTSDQIELGERYLNGNIVEKDEKKAFELFEKAANQNSDIGMLKLARCYKKGMGVTQDNAKAFSFYEKSAYMGNSDAMLALSDMYAGGDGIEKNMSKALYWKEKLAFKGNINAQKFILANQSVEYEKYDISADDALMVARECHKDRNYDWAKFCYERAISLGSKDAAFDYAKWLYEGNGIARNCNKAVEYLTQLGEENNVNAQMLLRKIYKENNGIAPDVKKEMYWAVKAAENGDVDSQVSLGYAYQNGIGVKKNKKLAFAMYEKAAKQGNQEAIKELIYCYANGNGVKKEVAYSGFYFKKLNDANTQLEIAKAFENGIGVKRNEALAMVMYEHMVKNNNMTAGYKLVELYIRNGGYDEAITLLADISKMPGGSGTDTYSIGSYYTGIIWEKKGRTQQALDCYKNSSLPEAKQRYETLRAAWRRNNYR